MSTFSGQVSYIDDSFGSVHAEIEDETSSQASDINGPRSGRWSVSSRGSRYSEIDDRSPTVWNGSSALDHAGQNQAQRRQTALDGSLLKKLAAVTLAEKAQAAHRVKGLESDVASFASKHTVRPPSLIQQEKPGGFFLPPNVKPRKKPDTAQAKIRHHGATVPYSTPLEPSTKYVTRSRNAPADPVEQSRAQRKAQAVGKTNQEITSNLPKLTKIPAVASDPAPMSTRVLFILPSTSYRTASKPSMNMSRQAAPSEGSDKQQKTRRQADGECAVAARTAATALISALSTSPKPASYKPNTPPKHAWVESIHSSSKDSGVPFGEIWDAPPPASTHSKQSRHSAAASMKSLRDAVKQISANSNALRSVTAAVQTSVKQTVESPVEHPKYSSVQGSGSLNIFEKMPSASIHSMQRSEASKESLKNAVQQININSELVRASNGGWDGVANQNSPKSRSAVNTSNAWDCDPPMGQHNAKELAGDWGEGAKRAGPASKSAGQSKQGSDDNVPASKHGARVSTGERQDIGQQATSDHRATSIKDRWEGHAPSAKHSSQASNGEWEDAGLGGMSEEAVVSHNFSHKSRASNHLSGGVQHINENSDWSKANDEEWAHGSVSQKVGSDGGWAQNKDSHEDAAPPSRAHSAAQKNIHRNSADAIELGGFFEETAASHHSSRASHLSEKELVDAIIQARADSRQGSSNGGWNEIGQGWTQPGSIRKGSHQPSIARGHQREAFERNTALSGRNACVASAHSCSNSKRSSRPSRISIPAPEEGPTIFAGGGWISPHPLSEASKPQERIVLPTKYVKGAAHGIEKNEMTFDEWKEVQRSGSAADLSPSKPASHRSGRRDHASHHSERSSRQRVDQTSRRSASGSHHTGLTEIAARRYQTELDAIVQQSPPAPVLKNSQAGVELEMPWDRC